MAGTCPNCETTYEYAVRYCEACGAAIDEDATLDDRTPRAEPGFVEQHWAKILVLTTLLLLPTLPGLVASGSAGGAVGFLMGAGLAGVALSATVVFVGDKVYGAVAA